MALFMITNQHRPEDCPELSDELVSYYDTKKPTNVSGVYCNCKAGEHRMFFLIEADNTKDSLEVVPSGFLDSATTVTRVETAYKFESS